MALNNFEWIKLAPLKSVFVKSAESSLAEEKLAFFKKLKCVGGWFNVYEKYEFTDYHDHRPNTLSCVYFLNCEEEVREIGDGEQ